MEGIKKTIQSANVRKREAKENKKIDRELRDLSKYQTRTMDGLNAYDAMGRASVAMQQKSKIKLSPADLNKFATIAANEELTPEQIGIIKNYIVDTMNKEELHTLDQFADWCDEFCEKDINGYACYMEELNEACGFDVMRGEGVSGYPFTNQF